MRRPIFQDENKTDDQKPASAQGYGAILGAIGIQAGVFLLGFLLVAFAGATFAVSRIIYVSVDLPGFILTVFLALALVSAAMLPEIRRVFLAFPITRLSPVPIALVPLVVSVISVHLVYHDYAFSMDEWMTRLQSEIFQSGQLTAFVPEEWRPYGRAMYHEFASYDPVSGALASNYRPGMAFLDAVFSLVGLGSYVSAILNAVAILLVARVARQLFPESAEAPIVAALLLATSQQAFANALTSYAMSAHLCFNLLWLTLFLEDRWRSHVLAALVGVATASLHQIHLHAFFALPFLLTLLRPFRPGLVLMYGAVYLVGHLAVLGWDWVSFNRYLTEAAAIVPEAAVKPVPNVLQRAWAMAKLAEIDNLFAVTANLARLLAWQSLALLPLLLVSWRYLRGDRRLMLLVWSLIFSTLPYLILMPDQGHGWGYRYLHGLLGHLVLLAIPGWIALRKTGTRPAYLGWVTACLLVSPFALIPFRALQIENMVGPYARATAMVSAQEAEVVIVDDFRVAIAKDIPRNSPVTPVRPISLSDWNLTAEQIRRLCRDYNVSIPEPSEYAALGIHTLDEVPEPLMEWYVAQKPAKDACNR